MKICSENESLLMKLIPLLLSIIGGLFVGVVWYSSPGVSLGEASCGVILTMIMIYVMFIWNKMCYDSQEIRTKTEQMKHQPTHKTKSNNRKL